MWNKKIDKIGWGIVALILVADGIRLAVTGQLWSRVRLSDQVPVSEGWHIVILGIVEAVVGLYIAYRLLRKTGA